MSAATLPDVMFYHLESQPLERVLPMLLEKTLAKGWRAVVQVGGEERLAALDNALWTYAEESFLPHGTAKTGAADLQPVYLTLGDDTPNGAGVRFLVDGAKAAAYAGAERFVYVFDGRDEDAVTLARAEWKVAKAAGCAVTYWRQSEDGRWEKQA
ncbi:MAG: DNA polymerase III subunit chi [Hyphomicrobium sp.]